MSAAASAVTRRGRWALSFADLCLLLLSFFVLLQASAGHRQEIVDGVARQFGAPPVHSEKIEADRLFQRGEAILTPAGAARLKALAHRYASGKDRIEIRSTGFDRSVNRFDNWDLAAARAGSVARALIAEGIPRQRLVIRGLDQEQGTGRAGQILTFTLRPAEE